LALGNHSRRTVLAQHVEHGVLGDAGFAENILAEKSMSSGSTLNPAAASRSIKSCLPYWRT
jgi:hypothetical protein